MAFGWSQEVIIWERRLRKVSHTVLSSMVGFHSSYNQMEVPKGPWDLAGC